MPQTIGITKARQNFPELVNRVAFGNERFIVERRGKPLATLINAEEYQQIMDILSNEGINDHIHEIPVRIQYDGKQYFVSDDIIDLYGVGKTVNEAREDYWIAVQEAYADLSAHADRLAPHLEKQLEYLRQIFTDEKQTSKHNENA